MKYFFAFGLFILFLIHLPFLILGENSYLIIHDNLEVEFIVIHVLKIAGKLLSINDDSIVPNMLGGIKRSHYHSEYSIIRVLFYFLPSFWAYVINSLIVRLVGFAGLWVLIKDYFYSRPNKWILLILSLTFATLPIYPIFGITVLGQALLLWSFLNLLNNKYLVISYFIILLFPFYSHFALSAPFITAALILFAIFHRVFKGKNINILFVYGVIIYLLSTYLANTSLINNFIHSVEDTHRVERVNEYMSISEVFFEFFDTLILGQFHASVYNFIPVIFLVVYSWIKKTDLRKQISLLFVFILSIVTFYAFYVNLKVFFEDSFHLLSEFSFSRFTILLPFLIFLIFSFAFMDNKIPRKVLLLTIISFAILSNYINTEITVNVARVMLPKNYTEEYTKYNSFFAEDVFDAIEDYIPEEKEDFKVINVGFHPAIALYNGFYTLDAYYVSYPLKHKQDFRKIIVGELDKDEELKENFDEWGNRCYAFSAELNKSCKYECDDDDSVEIVHLDYNIEQFKAMEGLYVFSSVPIRNHEKINLHFEKTFQSDNTDLSVYLYKAI